MAKGFGPKKAPQTTKRQTAYFKLIQALLKCPRGKELKILRKHPDLVDVGLVEMMEMVATILVGQREFYSAEFLIDLADFLYSSYIETDGSPVTGTFVKAPALLWEVLRAILLKGDEQTAYQILAINSDKLNEYFLLQFRLWIDCTLLRTQQKLKKPIALFLISFCKMLWLFPLGNRAINLEIAIAGLEGSAKILTYEADPQVWVQIQTDLAPAYRHRRRGDRSENLEKALTACTNALQISTRDTSPQEWAMVQNNLGNIYRDRIVGDQTENLEKAIACFEGALQVVSRDRAPELWGTLQNNLAVAYTRRVEGDRAQNFEKAIACYQVALKVRTDADWASSQWHLGTAYSERILGDKTQNLERAIAAYQAALQIYTPETYPERWANTQSDLGKAYRKIGQIANALTCFEAALTVFTPDSFPRECTDTGLELGKLTLAAGKKAEAFQCFATVIEAVETLDRWGNSEYLHQEIPETNFTYLQIVTLCLACGEREKAREYADRSGSPLIVGLLQDVQIQQITSFGQFLDRALQTVVESETNPQAFYQLLEDNLEQLNDSLVERLNTIKLFLSELGPAEEINIAAAILSFSRLVQHFDKGDEENNWKIAKAGYEVAANVFTQDKFPEQWDAIQKETRDRLLFQLFKALNESERNFHESERNFPTVDRLVETNSNRLDTADRLVETNSNRLDTADRLVETNSDRLDTVNRLVETNADRLDKHFFTGMPEVNVVLEANQAQLDEHFIKVLRSRSSAILSEVPPEDKKALAASIIGLSLCIHEFKKGNQANNLEIAITGYEIAATVLTRESTLEGWALCQMFFGNAYHRRFKGDWAENQERSIACCQNALQVYTREAFPEKWAAIQNTLALAYGNRIRGDQLENAELARTACFAAMEVDTREANPKSWAQLQNNLGIIYRDRICGDKAQNLEQAIACYENALLFRTREDFPELWAQTQMNLASAYRHRLHGDPVENVEKAIAANKAALQVYTQDAFPADWAGVQTNLGNAYVHRLEGDRNENLEMAIAAHQAALQVFNPDEFPREWAMAQMNLGSAYFMLALNEKAIACYRKAMEVFTPTAFPVDCLKAGTTLGNVSFVAGDWKLAIEGYGIAIEAVETSRTWATSEFRRQEIMEEAIDIYANIVQACINNKQLDKALEYVERSRSKRLVDLMASNDLYSSAEIPAEIQQYLQDFEQLQQQIDKERGRNQPSNDFDNSKLDNSRAALAAYNQIIADLEAEKLLIWEQLRRLDPVLAGQIRVNPLKFPSIQQLIDKPTTAIISFYTTVSDTFIFVVRQNEITLQSCAELGFEALHGWIFQNWLGQYVKDKDSWKEQLVGMLAEIAKQLNLNDLILWHLEGISELIIVPHFALHQIPFAALPIGDNRYLVDKFLIRYAPSCQVLEFCQQRPSLGNNLKCGTIEDATGDLPCASFEGEQLAVLYNIPDDRRLKGRGQATVSNYRELAQTVQILHSSHHAQSRFDNPLESTLILGDGCITLGQLMTPAWRLPQLSDVFLSCCETGLGVSEITGDILTFSTAFLSGGARSVISTLWAVDDLATALFSIFYYQEWQQGKNRLEAIREAQIKLRSLAGNTLAASYKTQLTELLKQKLKEIDQIRKKAKIKRDTYRVDCAIYQQLDEEYKKIAQIADQVYKALRNLDKFCQESKPFSHPFYWAAFTCTGVR
ncbi:MAG: CHAT domain-containing protein [Microcoleus sp. PH2017_10_PVI_O_A]|uniref:CHAT domain-containing protein n=1 Tax=unclassified Microcoleus TaxID=2642155 RepID=UPI001D271F93|nr:MULTISPECIES: CHAT domain-containing tetratricopeptide repeat protein [unclassified Microcoleus]TAE81093.1 MAG: CHAT domain-containing protein [Oscillatoriales cyanobacterium]MCC3407280.1 CHAT domain-containing protein [Microcoleus sp. PH2017_10_PVI_O_A]MCC3461356.1 CHAT domain-containing protein [Microcoleus sp. PH2017_11_PCY_U_A]MCC3479811.1 CHAT domain-containing protein [Microcoleus sp. PH2017_12_PCY_D_A]MCC3560761.1 CHAT domain-containing protein [Microcoleus sp. PH2017_27_LUM_O_A]